MSTFTTVFPILVVFFLLTTLIAVALRSSGQANTPALDWEEKPPE